MISMLPDLGGGIVDYMSEPRFRDWKPQKISVTNGGYWNQIEEVGHRLLEDAETDPAR